MFGKKPVSNSLIDAVKSVVSATQEDAAGVQIEAGEAVYVIEGAYEGHSGKIVEFPTAGKALVQLDRGRAIAITNDSFVCEHTIELFEAKKLDPVGQEDDDVDNDGDSDESDKYLMKRRKAIKKAMKEGNCGCCEGECQCSADCSDCDCNEEIEQVDELKVATKIRAAAQRAADASGDRIDARWATTDSGAKDAEKSAVKNQRSADKMRKQIAKKHGERAAKGVDNLANIRAGKKMSHSRVRNSQKSDPLANRPSTSIAKSGDRKGKVTRASAERLKTAIRNRRK